MTSRLDSRFYHYQTGVEEIDAEHYNLLVLMEAIEKNSDAPVAEVRLQIAAVVQLFHQHQLHEEAYMDSIEYPYAAYHKQHHAEFLQMLHEYKMVSPNHSTRYTTRRLSDHFLTHIDHHDIQLAQYAREHGRKTTY